MAGPAKGAREWVGSALTRALVSQHGSMQGEDFRADGGTGGELCARDELCVGEQQMDTGRASERAMVLACE